MSRGLIVLCLVAVGLMQGACSRDDGNAENFRAPSNNPALDRKIQALRPGMSLNAVRAKLGKPLGERDFEKDPEIHMLFYGRWQLLFEDGKLDRRIKYVIERTPPEPAHIDKEERALQRVVLSLKPGVSKTVVRSALGPPDTYEIVKGAPHSKEVLSYELWELTFVDNALVLRNKR